MNENEHIVTVEEQCSRTIVKREKVQADRSLHNQTPLAIEEVQKKLSISIHEERTSYSLEDKLKKVMEAKVEIPSTDDENAKLNTGENQKPKIQKVPAILLRVDQNNYKKYYEPRLVPIGPIHHDNQQLKLAETYKHRLAATFIENSGHKGEVLYKEIEDKIKGLRECYNEEVTRKYDDECLAWMLFLDGCSLLQFIESLECGNLIKFKFKVDQMAFAQQDLFLLENQLPFQVLILLMNACSSNRKEVLKSSINKFILRNGVVQGKENIDMEQNEPAHLLALLQLTLLKFIKPHNRHNSRNRHTFRNVQDLKNAGIQLEQGKLDFRIRFFTGYLCLPRLLVDDSTGSKFLNLAAYEMCPDNHQTEYGITSYIYFLDSLIDHPEDVKELRSADILQNCLGSDKEVAKLFNEISTGLVPDPEMYNHVINKIENHYMKKSMTWMNQVYHAHFSSPWTIVAFLAAVLVLALTGVQTWYTVKPPPGK